MMVDAFSHAALARDMALSEASRKLARPAIRALEARWPTRDGPVSVNRDGRVCLVLDALFCAQLSVVDDRVDARILAWDRDLTDRLATTTADVANVNDLVEDVADVIERLRPVGRPGRCRPPDTCCEHPVGTTARPERLSATSALAARAARERGEAPNPPTVSASRVRHLLQQRWPGAEVEAKYGRGGDWEFFLRPYGSSRVVINVEHRGSVGASVLVCSVIASMGLDGPSVVDGDESSVKDLIGRVDSWLHKTMPPAWVLDRAVEG